MNGELSNAKVIIREHFDELPEVVQDVILNSNWEYKIRNIVRDNNLHVDQGAAIENLVFVTMLGMESPENFIENAKDFANVDEKAAIKISEEVEDSIFTGIRRRLMDITENADTVGDIGRVTDELNKVSDAIEDQSKQIKVKSGDIKSTKRNSANSGSGSIFEEEDNEKIFDMSRPKKEVVGVKKESAESTNANKDTLVIDNPDKNIPTLDLESRYAKDAKVEESENTAKEEEVDMNANQDIAVADFESKRKPLSQQIPKDHFREGEEGEIEKEITTEKDTNTPDEIIDNTNTIEIKKEEKEQVKSDPEIIEEIPDQTKPPLNPIRVDFSEEEPISEEEQKKQDELMEVLGKTAENSATIKGNSVEIESPVVEIEEDIVKNNLNNPNISTEESIEIDQSKKTTTQIPTAKTEEDPYREPIE